MSRTRSNPKIHLSSLINNSIENGGILPLPLSPIKVNNNKVVMIENEIDSDLLTFEKELESD